MYKEVLQDMTHRIQSKKTQGHTHPGQNSRLLASQDLPIYKLDATYSATSLDLSNVLSSHFSEHYQATLHGTPNTLGTDRCTI